jgi:hypothetical protein
MARGTLWIFAFLFSAIVAWAIALLVWLGEIPNDANPSYDA